MADPFLAALLAVVATLILLAIVAFMLDIDAS